MKPGGGVATSSITTYGNTTSGDKRWAKNLSRNNNNNNNDNDHSYITMRQPYLLGLQGLVVYIPCCCSARNWRYNTIIARRDFVTLPEGRAPTEHEKEPVVLVVSLQHNMAALYKKAHFFCSISLLINVVRHQNRVRVSWMNIKNWSSYCTHGLLQVFEVPKIDYVISFHNAVLLSPTSRGSTTTTIDDDLLLLFVSISHIGFTCAPPHRSGSKPRIRHQNSHTTIPSSQSPTQDRLPTGEGTRRSRKKK